MPTRPRHCRPEAHALFAEQLPVLETTTGLVRGAVAIAMHQHPDATVAAAEWQFDALAERVRRRVRSGDPMAVIAHAHHVLYEEERFAGNVEHYYDPGNSYLPVVLATRTGLPITLTLVYKAVLDRLGLRVCGLNAPGHFLAHVALDPPHESMIVDPFFAGRTMTADEAHERIEQVTGTAVPRTAELLAPASHRQWLVRIIQNLLLIFSRDGRARDAAAMLELRHLLGGEG